MFDSVDLQTISGGYSIEIVGKRPSGMNIVKDIPAICIRDKSTNETTLRLLKKDFGESSAFELAEIYAKTVVWRLKRYLSLKYLGTPFSARKDIESECCYVCGESSLIPFRNNCSGIDVFCTNCESFFEWTW